MEGNETFIKYPFGNIDFCCAELEANVDTFYLTVKGMRGFFSDGERYWHTQCPFCGAELIVTKRCIICPDHRSGVVKDLEGADEWFIVISEAESEYDK